MVLYLEDDESVEEAVSRLWSASDGEGSDVEAWLAKHAPTMACMPRPCETTEEWLGLYRPQQ